MRETLNIERFKCFKKASILFDNLTVLMGSNGNGKSSVIQALLLLRTAFDNNGGLIYLNGPYGLSLGSANSIYNHDSDGNSFSIHICDENSNPMDGYIFEVDQRSDSLWVNATSTQNTKTSAISAHEMYYLTAERLGPRMSNKLGNLPFLHTGVNGEYVAQVLAYNGGRIKVEANRMFPKTKDPNLETQTNHWLNLIFPNIHISASMDINVLCTQIKISNTALDTDHINAPNVGFGISYALPIIVTGLIAKSNTFFIVENPEAHLHPAAQTAIGVFLARIAYCGVRVVIETHSDHVINGIQQFVALNPDWHDNVVINCFGISDYGLEISSILFDSNANFSQWPRGFMDQAQKDYIELCKIRQNV